MLVASLVAVGLGAGQAPRPPRRSGGGVTALGRAAQVRLVARLVGPDSLNRTAARWNVHGADLGHTFRHDGALWMVFGDTYGDQGLWSRTDWRSNTMARITDDDPSDGLSFDGMVAARDGRARELFGGRPGGPPVRTVIPTAGISVDGRMVLHYMSVRRWGGPGRWRVNHSGLVTSRDDGRTWVRQPEPRWPGDSGFAQVAMVEGPDRLYAFGIPSGRFGALRLARVAPGRLLDASAWRYWDGTGWSPDRTRAATVVPPPVGELSVRWSEYHGRWIMAYLDDRRDAIVLRTAREPTGPWSRPYPLVSARRHPRLYAPYLLPSTGGGPRLYFTMSRFGPYDVVLMEATIPSFDDLLVASGGAGSETDAGTEGGAGDVDGD